MNAFNRIRAASAKLKTEAQLHDGYMRADILRAVMVEVAADLDKLLADTADHWTDLGKQPPSRGLL